MEDMGMCLGLKKKCLLAPHPGKLWDTIRHP